MNTVLPILHIEDESVAVTPHAEHEFTLTSKDVARGYGVSAEVIRNHKANHADELTEGKHWVVENINTLGGSQQSTLWTKRGVIRLGFFIRSERAKRFRDAAEDLVLAAITPQPEAAADLLLRTIDALISRGLDPQQAADLAAGACAIKRICARRPSTNRADRIALVSDIFAQSSELHNSGVIQQNERGFYYFAAGGAK